MKNAWLRRLGLPAALVAIVGMAALVVTTRQVEPGAPLGDGAEVSLEDLTVLPLRASSCVEMRFEIVRVGDEAGAREQGRIVFSPSEESGVLERTCSLEYALAGQWSEFRATFLGHLSTGNAEFQLSDEAVEVLSATARAGAEADVKADVEGSTLLRLRITVDPAAAGGHVVISGPRLIAGDRIPVTGTISETSADGSGRTDARGVIKGDTAGDFVLLALDADRRITATSPVHLDRAAESSSEVTWEAAIDSRADAVLVLTSADPAIAVGSSLGDAPTSLLMLAERRPVDVRGQLSTEVALLDDLIVEVPSGLDVELDGDERSYGTRWEWGSESMTVIVDVAPGFDGSAEESARTLLHAHLGTLTSGPEERVAGDKTYWAYDFENDRGYWTNAFFLVERTRGSDGSAVLVRAPDPVLRDQVVEILIASMREEG